MCPDGVEYNTLEYCTRKIYNIKWKNEINYFQYIDLSSVDRDTHRIVNTIKIDRDNAPSRAQQVVNRGDILFGTTRPLLNRYCQINDEYHNQICSTGFCVLRPDSSKVNMRWIYHLISSSNFMEHIKFFQQGASYPSISDSDVKKYKIPLPPLPVQEEIVHILDKFTELITELITELTKRKQQYQYYLTKLLNFDQSSYMKFLYCCNLFRGEYITKKSCKDGNIPVILGGQEPAYYINKANHYGKAIVISRSGASAGFISYWDEPIFVTDGFIIEAKENMNIKFLYFYLKKQQEYLNKIKRGGGVPHITGKDISSLSIPVPPLEEQQRIVAILDRFDALCNDLTRGLPAEIEARKKQYEYYRDKLLTFKEAVQ